MIEQAKTFWRRIFGDRAEQSDETDLVDLASSAAGEVRDLDIDPDDPLLAYFLSHPDPVDVDDLNMESPVLDRVREQGYRVVVPLVSQGELIGLLNLGPRMSEQRYSSEDYRLLSNLATQASPALRVAQLAQQQLAEAQRRERIEHELQVARIIQETLLPEKLPELDGWKLGVHWQPARAVGGDFYDFIDLSDGRLGFIIADVTDKGVPAAMVMATTRSLVRATAEKIIKPGEVLARTNQLLHPDIPPNMFVTCLYLILDPINGRVQFANAGHNLPYLRTADGVNEMRATGMPLGLMEDMEYEENSFTIGPGEHLMLSSDGLVEAHNPVGEMFGFPRVKQIMASSSNGQSLIEHLLMELNSFTGDDYEQEDDITLLTLERVSSDTSDSVAGGVPHLLASFEIKSEPGNERKAIEKVLEAIQALQVPSATLKRLETAVGEATMNAMEHGNQYKDDTPVEITVTSNRGVISIQITDQGHEAHIPEATDPDLEAKIAGKQSPRGWGLYLIENMVDDLNVSRQDGKHTVELVMEVEQDDGTE